MIELQSYIIEKFKVRKGIVPKEYTPTANEKLKDIAIDIVSTYFGGYVPTSLEDEGFEFNNDDEKYSLADRMERYYVDEKNFDCSDNDADIIHAELMNWLEKHNK